MTQEHRTSRSSSRSDLDLGRDQNALTQLKTNAPGERGAIFTRRWIVDLILDIAGYLPSRDLSEAVIVEPACGDGAFLTAIVERLAKSCELHGASIVNLSDAIRAFDIDDDAVRNSKDCVVHALMAAGVPSGQARRLAAHWVLRADFLLDSKIKANADFVVGNPPYVRIEDVDGIRTAEYRSRWKTMTGRADLYVGFIEAGLSLLKPGGVLTYICADRWMRNQYGSGLRRLIERDFSVEVSLVMHDVDAFQDKVSAYPAIVKVRNSVQGKVLVADASADFGIESSRKFAELVLLNTKPKNVDRSFSVSLLDTWFSDSESCLLLRQNDWNYLRNWRRSFRGSRKLTFRSK